MNKESRNFVPIVAALITGGATLTAALIANWDKLFPKPPDVTTEITATADDAPGENGATPRATRTPNATTPTTPAASPTLTPSSPLPPSSPTPPRSRLVGVYEFVGQNYEPRPSNSLMQVSQTADDAYRWNTSGLFSGRVFRSEGELVMVRDGWLASVSASDDPSVVTQGRVPVDVGFDGTTLTITDRSSGRWIQWRKR